MKRNIVIVVAGILLLIMLSLFYTYATSVTMDETSGSADLTYNVNLSDPETTTITVEAGKTKYFDLFITNNNGGTIKYGLAYSGTKPSGVTIAQVDTSKNKVSDLIESNSTNQVSLVIVNNTNSDLTYDIIPVTGYANGGDLIVPEGYTLISDIYKFPKYLDDSGANIPDIVEGMVPVTYYNNEWVKADTTSKNATYKWYDYNEKKWANAVLVSSTNRQTYIDAEPGVVIPESDIFAYYVWIPRYRYKVWNINKEIGVDSYSARTTGIDIEFEPETETNGILTCTSYSFASPSSSAGSPNETCSGSNGEYYTHPAFWWDIDGDGTRETNEEVRGIWVGKFEVSNSTSQIKIKPNVKILRHDVVSNFSSAIQNMQASGNSYGLTTDTTVADSHMLKNIEWGAVAYLTNSDYGRCSNNSCTEVTINSNSSYYTGGNNYASNVNQSTTGNIYGIYDMAGGAAEYVMGNMSSATESYTYNEGFAGSKFSYSTTTAKYVDTYAYGTTRDDQTAYNRARLGDATGEVVLSSGGEGGWYGDNTHFINDSSNQWFVRGGIYTDVTSVGLFYFSALTGGGTEFYSARAALIVIPE